MRTDATPPPVTQAPDTLAARLRGLAGRWEVLILGLLVVTAIVGQYISSKFLSTASFTSGTLDYSEVALMALPLALVIITAEIDLSVASVLALSSAVMGWMWAEGYSMGTIIVVCLAVGALCGAFNGALVTQLGLPSLAVTIGTLALFRGLAFVVIGDRSETSFPTAWTDWAFDEFAGTPVPNTIALFAVLAVAFAVLLHATRFGRAVFAIGANQEAARFSGVRVKRIKMILFVLCGVVAALAGIVLTLRNSTAAANVGTGYELTAIAAVVLGGVSIFGGRGTIAGVVLALLLLAGIQKALTLSPDISTAWIPIVVGALLIGSVLGPNLVNRARELRARSRSRGARPPRPGASVSRPQEET